MKNKSLNYFIIFLCAGAILMLQSCKKDNNFYPSAMEISLASQYSNQPFEFVLTGAPTITTQVGINVASVELPSTQSTATLGIEQPWIDQYNATQSAIATKAQADYLAANALHKNNDPDYPYSWIPMELLPDSLYAISAYDLTVPANERNAYSNVTIKTSKFERGHNYVLPLTITKSSLIISSWKHLPLWFISSQFSGTFNNFHANLSGGAYNLSYDDVMHLITIDQHTVADTLTIGDFFGGFTQYHFNGDGSVSVTAGSSSATPTDYGAKVITSSSNPTTGEFSVKFSVLAGSYTFDINYKR